MNTHDSAILITGAARRLGAQIARHLHTAGCRVLLHYRHSALEATELSAELNDIRPNSAAIFYADLCDHQACNTLIAEAAARYGRLDALVNNASSFFATPIGSIDEAVWNDLIGSNLKGPLFLAQAAAPYLRASHGAMVNIVDIHAERPLPGYPVYCAAKAGLLGLTKALAAELAPQVRVNAVAPGPIAWPEEGQDFPPTARDAIIEHTLLKRSGNPEDIARTVAFLLFASPYVTGQVINVDGGRTAYL